jgi:hypothetical protein
MSTFADWAAERDAAQPCPPGFYHWEWAATLLTGLRVRPSSWPSPHRIDAATGQITRMNEGERRRLAQECSSLTCRTHIYFTEVEVSSTLKQYGKTPRWPDYTGTTQPAEYPPRSFESKHAVYVEGWDAAWLLLRNGVRPSHWPDVYVLTDGDPEPQYAEDKTAWIRRLFRGEACSQRVLMLKHELDRVVRDEQVAKRETIRRVNEEFNRKQAQVFMPTPQAVNGSILGVAGYDAATALRNADAPMWEFQEQYAQNEAMRRGSLPAPMNDGRRAPSNAVLPPSTRNETSAHAEGAVTGAASESDQRNEIVSTGPEVRRAKTRGKGQLRRAIDKAPDEILLRSDNEALMNWIATNDAIPDYRFKQNGTQSGMRIFEELAAGGVWAEVSEKAFKDRASEARRARKESRSSKAGRKTG